MNRVLWSAGLHPFAMTERVIAASSAGYSRMSLNSGELADLGTRGLRDIRKLADDSGVAIEVLEPVLTWLPTDPRWPLARATLDDIARCAEILEPRAICALAGNDHGVSRAEVIDRFHSLCDWGEARGLEIAFEFAPASAIRTLLEARDLVAHSRATILFDSWQFFRGGGLLEQIVESPIHYVQVSDATTAIEGSVGRDAWNRRLPGRGDIDLVGIVRRLADIRALGSYGSEAPRAFPSGASCLEVISEETLALDALMAAALGQL